MYCHKSHTGWFQCQPAVTPWIGNETWAEETVSGYRNEMGSESRNGNEIGSSFCLSVHRSGGLASGSVVRENGSGSEERGNGKKNAVCLDSCRGEGRDTEITVYHIYTINCYLIRALYF